LIDRDPLENSAHPVHSTINETIRNEWGRILASLTKTLGDLQLAEDSVQDAVESALVHWRKNGLPNSPSAWLIKTARRKAIDRIRRMKNFASKQAEITHLIELDAQSLEENEPDLEGTAIGDKRLEMIFTCCHPSIEEKSRLALTLRTIGGLTTEEIASAFLDKTETMAARLTRAKKKIALAKIPYEIPHKDILPERLQSVLSVIYLIFNEGYSANASDQLVRRELMDEARRLALLLHDLMPNETEPAGMVALILLHDSRRESRIGNQGEFIALEFQNRDLWNHANIKSGIAYLKAALAKGKIGPYQLQAAISACHAEAPSWDQTDWPQISSLYELLYSIQPTPVVRLNQAYAVSHAQSPKIALEKILPLEKELANYQPYHVTKADLLRRCGHLKEARQSLMRAIDLTTNKSEINHLQNELGKLALN